MCTEAKKNRLQWYIIFNHNIKLTENQSDLCEVNLTFKECADSLIFMTYSKSPGSDWYTVDIMIFFG